MTAHPDDEKVAAFLDGRLEGDGREKMLAELVEGSPDDRRALTATAAILRQEEAEEEARAVRVLAEFMGWRDVALSRGCPDAWPNFNAGDGVMYVQRVSGGNSLPWNPFADANAEQEVAERALEVMTAEQLARVGALTDRMWARRSHELYRSRGIIVEDEHLSVLLRTGDRARAIYRTLTEAR